MKGFIAPIYLLIVFILVLAIVGFIYFSQDDKSRCNRVALEQIAQLMKEHPENQEYQKSTQSWLHIGDPVYNKLYLSCLQK